MTERLARACAGRPWRTVLAWLVAIVASFVVIALFLGDALTTEGDVTTNPESQRANRLLGESFAPGGDREAGPVELVVIRSDRYRVDDEPFRAEVRRLAAEGERTGVVASIRSWYETSDPALVSADRDALLTPITLRSDHVEPIVDLVTAADRAPDFDVGITGGLTVDRDFETLSQEDLQKGELLFGLPAALVILVLVFGAVVAGLVPVVLALVSIVVAVALTALVGQAYELSLFVVNMITAMGLALGIDYSLFIVTRYREERVAGVPKLDAIVNAAGTASRAVLFSGLAFVLAMFGMVLVPDTILRSLAAGAILVGIVSVLAAMTLLPAVLSLLGDRVNAVRVPVLGRRLTERGGVESRFWTGVVRRVIRRPLVALVAAAVLLLAAAVPVLDLTTGFSGISTLPDRLAGKRGFDLLQQEFPAAGLDPVQIVVRADATSPPVSAALERLTDAMAARPELGPAGPPQPAPGGDVTLVEVPLVVDVNSTAAYDAVRELRGEIIPAAFTGLDAEVLVTGETAEGVDYFALVGRWLPIVFTLVLGLSFVLLTVAFRSVVIPLCAIALNLLSVGAAYGLLVLVFQNGLGADLLGFTQVDTIEAWVPLFLFSVLFGLSMDYEVFLLSRIRERYAETGSTDDAVAFGVGSTARLITGAALIIIVVFSGFAAGELVMFQQMGFGVAVALLVDATIIRSVLVPAVMSLLGPWNWYFPRRLAWVPDVHVEGRRGGPGHREAASLD